MRSGLLNNGLSDIFYGRSCCVVVWTNEKLCVAFCVCLFLLLRLGAYF